MGSKIRGSALSIAVAASLVAVGLVAPAAQASADPTLTSGALAETSNPAPDPLPETELDEEWAAPEDAQGDPAIAAEADAPEEDWSLPEGSTASRAPTGTVIGAPGLGALPYFSFDQVNLSTDTVARVNLGNGNLLLTSADGALNGPSLSVRNDRFYNGLSTANGSIGAGWSSPLSAFDFGLQVTSSTSATFLGPNGLRATFTKSGSVWSAPAGFNATLVDGTSTKTLTYKSSGEKLVFNSSGWIIQDLDRNGVGTTYTYDNYTGLIETVTEASGRFYDVTWGTTTASVSIITSIADSAGRTTTYAHNTAGQLTRVDSPGGYWEEYDYDTSGRISQMRAIGTDGSATTQKIDFTYDTQSRVKTIKRGALTGAYLTTQTYAYTSGQTTVTDGRGKVATYAIDSAGRVTSTTDALGRARGTTWTANSDVATTTDATGSGSTSGQTTTYSYDSLNNAIGTTLPTGAAASAGYATGATCTGTGGMSYQPKCATDDAGNKKKVDYDSNGNVLKITDTTTGGTGAAPQQYTYAASGAGCTGGTGFNGQVCTSKDGNGNVTSYKYDADGNLIKVTPPAPQGATTYTYDSIGRVSTVTDGNSDQTIYAYNVRDEIVTTYFDGGPTLMTTWYSNGIKSGDNEATGTTGPLTFNYYDVLSRLTQQTTRFSAHTVNYNFTYDAAHNVLSSADSEYGTTNYVYDDANELVQLIEPGGTCATGTGSAAGSYCVKFTYDGNGQEKTRTLPGNATIVTTRDASARVMRITAKNSAGTVVADVGYSYTVTGGTGPTADRSAIQTRTSYLAAGLPAGSITTYAYDSLKRLTSAVEKVGTTTNASWTYAYDAAGNRTQQVRAGNTGATAGTINYSYNAANQLTSTSTDTTTWTYDAVGNQTRNGITGQTATFNPKGAVTGIGSDTYTAFGQGNSATLTRSASSTSFRNSPLGLAAETVGTSGRPYDRTPTGMAVGQARTYYFVTDSLGSTIGVFDGTGTYYGGYSYSPYGETRYVGSNASLATINVRYIGGYLDNANGLYRLGARYYDPTTGRFTQYDPSGQESHPYAYAACNPINAKDPTGLSWKDVCNSLYDAADIYGSALGTEVTIGAILLAASGIGVGGAAALAIAGYLLDKYKPSQLGRLLWC